MEANKVIAVQRAASLVPLADMMGGFGLTLDDVLSGTDVTADQVRPDGFISYADFNAILENAGRLTGREDIGIMLGQRQSLAALGPLGAVMGNAATLGEALSIFTAFQINNSTGGTVYLMRADQDVILGYGVYDPTVRVSPLFHDLVFAIGCRMIADLTGGAVGPEEILFSRTTPADLAPYQRLSRCPVRFGQIQTGLLLRASSMGFALPQSDPMAHDKALADLLTLMKGTPPTLAGRVKHLLRPQLLVGESTMDKVAVRLGLHPRVLRRRLLADGTTFEALKDEVRYAAARDLLRLDTLGIDDIAATLDYGSASAFVHAFKRWSGQSPGRWRMGALAAGA